MSGGLCLFTGAMAYDRHQQNVESKSIIAHARAVNALHAHCAKRTVEKRIRKRTSTAPQFEVKVIEEKPSS
jgi:hypothetical protein